MEVFPYIVHGAVELHVGSQGRTTTAVTLDGSHHAKDGSVASEDGEFVGEVPVGKPLSVEEQFDDFEHRLRCGNNRFIILPKFLSELDREKIEVVFSDHLGLAVTAQSLPERSIRSCEPEVSIFHEEGN